MTLITGYTYSLNDKISDDIKSTNNEIVGLNFPSLKRMYGKYRKLNISLAITLMAKNLSLILIDLSEDTSNIMNFKNIASYLSDEILKWPCHFQYIQ